MITNSVPWAFQMEGFDASYEPVFYGFSFPRNGELLQ